MEKQGKNGYRRWLWVFAGEDSVVYVLDPTRSHEVPEGHFPADAQGVLIVDRYIAYKAMKQVQADKLILVFCSAHVRRDFVRVGKGYPELKEWALTWLRQIRELYRLHREQRQYQSSSREYGQVDATSRQHVAAMCQQRDAELADPKLREPCRKALTSLLEHWSGLTVFLDDPRIPRDSFAEPPRRPFDIGMLLRYTSYSSLRLLPAGVTQLPGGTVSQGKLPQFTAH